MAKVDGAPRDAHPGDARSIRPWFDTPTSEALGNRRGSQEPPRITDTTAPVIEEVWPEHPTKMQAETEGLSLNI